MKKEKLIKFLEVAVGILLLLAIIVAIMYFIKLQREKEYNEKVYNNAVSSINSLYQNVDKKIIKYEITDKDIKETEKKIKKIKYITKKEDLEKKLESIKKFYKVKTTLESYFTEEVLNSNVTLDQINKLIKEYEKLTEGNKEQFKAKIEKMKPQYEAIQALDEKVASLFEDTERTKVKEDVTREVYNEALAQVDTVVQPDIIEKEKGYLAIVDQELTRKEEAERRRIEEEKRKERERQIAAAWVKLDIPYISQNRTGVLNGCEAASLLMALKYKGYLGGMDLVTYANMMPKSTDPNAGFTYSIFDLEPRDVAHWIAPGALAAFGRSSSGANVTDISGSSLDTLDNEVLSGNPVVIYLTGSLAAPKEWKEGAPINLHVLVLSGYNTMTGDQFLTDPWTRASYTWTVSKKKLASLYNAVGNRAVVVR